MRLENIQVTHIEHIELWSVDLFLSRTGASSLAVFADFPIPFASVRPFVTIAHLPS